MTRKQQKHISSIVLCDTWLHLQDQVPLYLRQRAVVPASLRCTVDIFARFAQCSLPCQFTALIHALSPPAPAPLPPSHAFGLTGLTWLVRTCT